MSSERNDTLLKYDPKPLTQAEIEEIQHRARIAKQWVTDLTAIRYDHGGGRLYWESASGSRLLILDAYNEPSRELFFEAHKDIPRLLATLAARDAEIARLKEGRIIDIVFDGPPSHESGRFVEVEEAGSSIEIGSWFKRPDGLWALRLRAARGGKP